MHAYLIIAHDQFDLLESLLKCIDDERNDIYIHIDSPFKARYQQDPKRSAKTPPR